MASTKVNLIVDVVHHLIFVASSCHILKTSNLRNRLGAEGCAGLIDCVIRVRLEISRQQQENRRSIDMC